MVTPLNFYFFTSINLFFPASHFVPALATRIIRENRYASSLKKIPIHLASIIIGNGYINPRAHQLSYAEYSCDNNKCTFDYLNSFCMILIIIIFRRQTYL